MKIEYISNDNSIKIELHYYRSYNIRYYSTGKHRPLVTQCLVFMNGLLKSYGEVVKHSEDIDNYEFSIKESTKKAIKCIPFRDMRKDIWALIDNKLNN